MDQRLIWSLVLIIFILASHVSDALARHHHIKLRHGRHRRQHGESYLPASFVLDTNEEETGTWGPWSVPSSCSRSCGGGVAHQTRHCLDVDDRRSNTCTGAKKRFFSCNIQDCPDPTKDFRAEQCAEYNNVPIEGVYYDWVPYTGGPNKCELNCMPRGERFFYRHKLSVTDGTLCTTEKTDVCIEGKCMPVGCDMMLGSDAKEDKCRECGGDGSACDTVAGLLDMNDLQVGYNDILLIPAGATNIAINEVRQSSNYLAIRNATGHYYLNGNWRIDFPRSLRFAGTVFHYERRPKEFLAADIISALGPTSEAIYVVLLYQSTNVGVEYEYSIPKRLSQSTDSDSYTWVAEEFSECSASCGGGIRSRLVRCVRRRDNEEVDENLCDQQLEPVGTEVCGDEPCPPEWVLEDWGPCSKECGSGGEQSREIKCEQIISGGVPFIVDDVRCLDMVGPKDIEVRECNQNVECPQWHIGPWKPCDHLCGEGKEKRKITCFTKVNGKIVVLPDSKCKEERPESEKPCELRPCAGLDWVVSKWSGCDNKCGLTQETRTTSCVTLEGKVYPDEKCNPETKPKLVRECAAQEKCKFQWYTTQWSECSAKCGTGIQTRKVFCATSLLESDSITKVEDDKCDQSKKYNDTKECTAEIEECKGEWFTGPWSECSKPCGGGDMTRKVICMKDNKVVPGEGNCYEGDVRYSSENCNEKACEEDEVIPVGPGKPSAPSEDEEECEDYENDDFVSVDFDFDMKEQNDEPVWDDLDYPMLGDGPLNDSDEEQKKLENTLKELGNLNKIDIEESSGDNMEESSGDGNDYSTESVTSDYSTTFEGSGSEPTDFTDESSISTSFSSSSSENTESTFSTESTITELTKSTIIDSTQSTKTGVTSSNNIGSTSSQKSFTPFTEATQSSRKIDQTQNNVPYFGEVDPYDISDYLDIPDSDSTTESDFTPDSTSISGSSSSLYTEATGDTSQSTDVSNSEATVSTVASSSDSSKESSFETTESSISVTTASSSSNTMISSSSEGSTGTTVTSNSETMEPTSLITTVESSSGKTEESSSDVTKLSSSVTMESSSSDTSSSPLETSESFSLGTTVSSDSSRTESSSLETTVSSSSEATTITSAETKESSSTDTTILPSSKTTITSGSETTESSSTGPTITSSSVTTESSSSETTVSGSSSVSSGSETTESSSTGPTITSSSVTTESSSSETTVSGSSSVSSETTIFSTATAITGSESTGTSEQSTEFLETSESGITTEISETSFSAETDITTESGITSEITASGITEIEEELYTTEQSHITDFWTTIGSTEQTTRKPRPKCKPRLPKKTCKSSQFGCCYDGIKAAKGPFGKGCPIPKTCNETEFGCCPDGVSPATGHNNKGCPPSHCSETLFGCCPDNITPAEGNDYEGCKIPCNQTEFGCCPDNETTAAGEDNLGCCNTTTYGCCPDGIEPASGPDGEGCEEEEISSTTSASTISSTTEEYSTTKISTTSTEIVEDCATSEFGCCPDNKTKATGRNFEGCDIINTENCTASYYGCCPDGVSAALGPNNQGCHTACENTTYGCCDDGSTPAHGLNREGCCLTTTYGCCPDNIRHALGPDLYGCGCQYSSYGCCPDNTTTAQGPNNEGCGCGYTTHGCCPDRLTPSRGPSFEGCPCHTYQFGCCPDGITIAKGPHNQGCGCENTEFKCCSDGVTPAKGQNYAGCMCDASKYGCCPDGVEEAQGENFEGCITVPSTPGAACALEKVRGSCREFSVKWYFDTEYGGCSRFWYGGCEGNENRFKSQEECKDVCVEPKGRDACFLPKIAGPCEGYHPTWYYDTERKQCGQFIYSGCLGNANKFKTRDECEELCITPDDVDPCEQPKESGPCQGNFTRWFFNKETSSCEEFTYGGCKANKNNFQTQVSCQQQCLTPGHSRVQDVCTLEKEPGPCPGSLLRWYYDAKRKSCRQFVYGGCKGNGNKFRTYAACEQRCPVRDSCSLPREEGSCTEKHARWFFSQSENRCMPFYYTGCGGSKNNYETKDACDNDCPPKIEQDICLLPALLGECDNYTQRWYYDSYEQHCRKFYYGGCGGNGNNFQTENDCLHRCELPSNTSVPIVEEFRSEFCFLPNDHGPCNEDLTPWYYDSRYGICQQFRYGGCQGNGNRFATAEECENRCGHVQDACELPAVVGPCRALIPKYYYDRHTDECYKFGYGGCQGNKNNFIDKNSCEQRCKKQVNVTTPVVITTPAVPESDLRSSVCSAPLDAGNCNDDVTAYYYNEQEKACQAFIYSGCKGNANRFQTEEQCERICGNFRGQDVCSLYSDPGPCRGAFPKFFYDPNVRGCREFLYGGCDGNANRFTSRTECESVCIHHEEPPVPGNSTEVSNLAICREPVNMGSGSTGAFKRFYYNDEYQNCIAFVYTGTGGNLNKFKTYESCIKTCLPTSNEVLEPEEKPMNPCAEAAAECNSIHCPYGKEAYVDYQDCQRCRCADPCRSEICPEGTKCAITLVAQGESIMYQSVCRSKLKPGTCPQVLNSTTCEKECNSDAECTDNLKCCINGCGSSCLEPAPIEPLTTSPPEIIPVTEPAYIPEPPTIQQPEEPKLRAEEGNYVIMKCVVSGRPRPVISWRKGVSLIDNTVSRHLIKEDGSLQIVSLYTTDAGIYTCTADNRVAAPVRIQYELDITEPHEQTSAILGEPGYKVTVTLNSLVLLPCYAVGWPRPTVTWWHEEEMIPLFNDEYELQRDYSLKIHKVTLAKLGVYTCQAYNSILKPASWSITLQAIGPVSNVNSEYQQYIKYLVNPPKRPTYVVANPEDDFERKKRPTYVVANPEDDFERKTTQARDIQTYAPLYPNNRPTYGSVVNSVPALSPENVPVPKYTVPVKVNVSADEGPYSEGGEFSIACNVDGYPIPQVLWFKDNNLIETSNRIQISEANRLIISSAEKNDSGTYRCKAANEYTSGSDSVDIIVSGIYIHPNCQDNSFFANCDLIVKGRFCKHNYYAKFCCRSCTEAGQLSARGSHINETRRKKRSIFPLL